jgi:hypothetical protein
MSNWVKLHPEQFAEQLSAFRGCKSPEKSIGEWACGLSAGIAGAMLRLGASQAESDGHAYGASLLNASKEDKNSTSEKQRARAHARWNKQPTSDATAMPRHESGTAENDATAMPRHESGTAENDATAMPREEKRREEKRRDLSPGGDKRERAPLPPMPDWKAAKIQALRRRIEDHRTKADRWEKLNPRPENWTRELREKIESARNAIREIETEILSNGVPL